MFTKFLNTFYEIDASDVTQLLKTGEVKIKDVYDYAGKILFFTTAIPNYLISKGVVGLCGLLIEGLKSVKFPEEDWLPSVGNNERFTPAFFVPSPTKVNTDQKQNKQTSHVMTNPSTKITLLTVSMISDALKKAENDYINFLQIIENITNENTKMNVLEGDSNFIKDFFLHIINKTTAFIKKGIEIIKILHEQIETLIKLNINVLNAFLCGLENGFIDGVNGVLTIIKWIFDANVEFNEILKDIQNKLPPALEVIDQFLQAMSNFDFGAIFNALIDEVIHFLKTLSSEFVAGEIERTLCILAYTAGNIIGMIIEFIAELLLTGGVAAVTKFFESIANAGTKIVEIITNLVKRIFNITLEEIAISMINGLRLLTRFLGAGKEKIVEFFKAFFAEMRTLFGLGLKPETEALFERLGIKWKIGGYKVYSVGPGMLGGGARVIREGCSIEYKGFVIYRETKAEIEAIAKELETMTKEEAEKYLDELVNLQRFGFKIFKFAQEFIEHIVLGHIRLWKMNSRTGAFVEEIKYVVGQGGAAAENGFSYAIKSVGGSHVINNLNNRFVRIVENLGTYTLKTGETVKKVQLEYWVEELNSWVKKSKNLYDEHTFFPNSWDSKKIQETVLEASKNIIENKGTKFIGKTKDGIRIEFYIDDITKEITTAYIKI